jgi:hypothetical protein
MMVLGNIHPPGEGRSMQRPCAGELTSDDGLSLIGTAIGRAFDRSPSLELAFTLPESGLLVEVENGEVI